MYKNLLPIGSVVLLKGGNKKIMICGRIQTKAGDDKIYDYSACFFPEGIINPNNMFFFNRDAIETVSFLGCQDVDEVAFRQEYLGKLGELEIKDGAIVEKNQD